MRSVVIFSLLLAALLQVGCHLAFPFDTTAPAPDGAAVDTVADDAGLVDSPRADTLVHDLLVDQGPNKDQPPSPDAPVLDAPAPPDAAPPDAAPPDAPPPDAPPPDGMISIPGTWTTAYKGTFSMGSPASEPCRATNPAAPLETQHTVTLGHDLLIQKTEVTQGQFQALMGYNPSHYTGCSTCPVEQVSWHEAAAYCNALSKLANRSACYVDTAGGSACTGSNNCLAAGEVCIQGTCRRYTPDPAYATTKIHTCPGYRLPTEAEWESAYRAQSKGAYYSGGNVSANCTICALETNADLIGWYCANSGYKTQPVGKKKKNAWGLHDMAGSVYEWCNDCYLNDLGSMAQVDPDPTCPPSLRVLRGGSHLDQARKIRAANRYAAAPQTVDKRHGFRCVRTK